MGWRLLLLSSCLGQDDPGALVEGLASDRVERREDAERKLLELGAAARPALEKALQGPDAELRRAAIYAIGLVRPEGGAAALAALLKDPDETILILSARTLAEIAGQEAVPHLLPLLDHAPPPEKRNVLEPDFRGPGVREWTIRFLCELDSPEGLEANAASLRKSGGAPSPFHLNALRRPELWARLRKLPRRSWTTGQDGRKLLDALSEEAGLPLEEIRDAIPGPKSFRFGFHDCRPREGGFLEQLEWAAGDADVGVVLESDRIRLISLYRERDEWRAWGQERK